MKSKMTFTLKNVNVQAAGADIRVEELTISGDFEGSEEFISGMLAMYSSVINAVTQAVAEEEEEEEPVTSTDRPVV